MKLIDVINPWLAKERREHAATNAALREQIMQLQTQLLEARKNDARDSKGRYKGNAV